MNRSVVWICGTVVVVAVIAAATFLLYTSTTNSVGGAGGGREAPPSFLNGSVSVGTATDQPGLSRLNTQTNRTEGFDADFARWLGDNSGGRWNPALSPVSIVGRIPALQKNERKLVIDSFSINDERLKSIDMAGPYLVTDEGVMVREGDERFKSADAVTGAKVCTVRGSTSETELVKRRALLNTPDGIGECVNQLLSGQVDVVSIDQLILVGLARANPGLYVEPDVKFGFREQYGVGMPYGSFDECQEITDQIARFVNSPDWDGYFRNAFGTDLDPNQYKPSALNPCKVRSSN